MLIGFEYYTRLEYKQVNTVPEEYLNELEPFKLIYNGYYFISDIGLNWFQAAQECRKMGANLMSLKSDEERQMVGLELNVNQTYWIDITNLGQSQYVSIATGQEPKYVNWFNEEINGDLHADKEKKNCVKLIYDKQDHFIMKISHCMEESRFVCQLSTPQTISILAW